MFPQEQSRFDMLFPQYEVQKDGYVYGAEAVALFSKSGADKGDLRKIWQLADDPVDNRLSKLEFAIAMHLIVCVTKKGLPCPASLPPSLRALKDNEASGVGADIAAAGGGPPPLTPQPHGQPMQQQQQPPAMFPGSVPATPKPDSIQQQPAQPVSGLSSMPSPSHAIQQHPHMSMGTAPPQPQVGDSAGMAGPPPLGHAVGGTSISDAFSGLDPAGTVEYNSAPVAGSTGGVSSSNPPPSPGAAGPPAIAPASVAGAPPPLSISHPPPDVKDSETPAAASVTAIVPATQVGEDLEKLRATLQKLQAENVSLKAQLGSVSEEEHDVRSEINRTVSEIATRNQYLASLREKVAIAKAALIEATAELKGHKEKKGMIEDLIGEEQKTLEALDSAQQAIQGLKDTDDRLQQEEEGKNAAGSAFESGLFGGSPASTPLQPAPTSTGTVGAVDPSAFAPTEAEGQQRYLGFAPPAPGPPQQQPEQTSYGQEMAGYGGLMGGHTPEVPSVQQPDEVPPSEAPMGGGHPSMTDTSSMNANSFSLNATGDGRSFSVEEIDYMKNQVQELDRKALSAEDAQRQLMAELERLRREAEQAEIEAAEKMSAIDGTKKKRFGKGGKKEAMKEAEAARGEALEKKQRADAAQAALSNAQAEAIKAKRQSDDLRQRTEEALLQAASAASMSEQQQEAPVAFAPPSSVPVVPPMGSSNYTGYGAPPPMEQQPVNAAAPPSAPPVPHMGANYNGGYGAPPPIPAMPADKSNGEMGNGHDMPAMGGFPMEFQQPMMAMGGMQQPMGAVMGMGGVAMGEIPNSGTDDGGIPSPNDTLHSDYANPFGGL